ncbi:hypothetical protein A2691_01105 [Candidatus Woesebacteria bacterium RIFCSPHIGHO2_01_FULL_39_23]|nr:MAG: hypothetical protein A2691_01105 [Candidatus Woesebacteria bacterium RIFCSPHIGHO2_01_FULL_39_23]
MGERMEETLRQIALQVKSARKKAKMTQQDLALKCGSGQSVISKLENSKLDPTIKYLSKVSSTFGTKIKISI